MNYKFYKKTIDTTGTVYFLVESQEIISNFDFTLKSFNQINEIIDGVERGKTKPKENAYQWANEDIYVISNENGLFLIDLMAQRAGETDQDKLGLQLTHQEFIQFLQDFKNFVEQNS
ncbi:hypothetical protein [Olleya sp. ITB9]|uniref:hypothetical protein n=1 Tax=Olleya sp. ITB9 TaxID=1715648 RepID=UPI0006D0C4E0|nr:hypothetical protein [Olleya sp. ITB9]